MFWNVGATIGRPHLSEAGEITDSAILNIPKCYPPVILDKYVIMPNHIHLLLRLQNEDGRPMVAPTVSTVIQQLKGYVTKQVGQSIWQKSFHDHIIRNEESYKQIWQYIETNPIKWEEDCFYTPAQR